MSSQVRALFAACERVPGFSSSGTRLAHLATAFATYLEGDGLSLKSEELAHIQKLGTARMMRVPTPDGGFIERASTFQRALKRQLEGDAYDFVHVTDVWAGAVAAQHKEMAEVALVTDLQDLPTQSLPERLPDVIADERIRNVIRRGEQLALSRSNAVVVCGQAASRAAVAAGARPELVHVIAHGIDTSVFFHSSIELRLHDGFTIVYAGVPSPSRGLNQFLSALKALPAGVKGVLCRLRGREPGADEAIAAQGLQDRITWQDCTTQQKLGSVLQMADVVVLLPTGASGTLHGAHIPRRMLEAMMCKRAVVVAETEGVREVLQDKVNGLVIPQKDARALTTALQTLQQDTALRNRLAQRAAETASQFSWADRLHEYGKLYEKLIEVPLNIPDPKKAKASTSRDSAGPRRAPGVGIMRDEKAASAARAAAAKPPPPTNVPPPPAAPAPASVVVNTAPSVVVTPPVSAPAPAPAPVPAPVEQKPSIVISPPVMVPPPVFMDSSKIPGAVFPSAFNAPQPVVGAPIAPPARAPTPAPGSAFTPLVTSPELVVAPVPERWSFNTSPTQADGGPPSIRGTPIVPFSVDNSNPPVTPAFLTEPTPSSESIPPMPLVPSVEIAAPRPVESAPPTTSESGDVWGGDTVAVEQPPQHMEQTPAPEHVEAPLPVLNEPTDPPMQLTPPPTQNPFQVMPGPGAAARGPLGLRSLALLEAVEGHTPAPSSPGPSVDETERLMLRGDSAKNLKPVPEVTIPGKPPPTKDE